MPGAVVVGQAPNPAIGSAGRPLPQTTVPAGSGPFLRFARAASRPGYSRAGDALTTPSITNPLAAAPGYLRWLDLTFVLSGGTGSAAVLSADGPYNLVSMIQFKDPWGTPLLTGPGYELLYLLHKYGGEGFSPLYHGKTISQLPSWSALTTPGTRTFSTMTA